MVDISVERAFRPPDLCAIPELVKEAMLAKGLRVGTASHSSVPLRSAWGFYPVHADDLTKELVRELRKNGFEQRPDGFLTRGDAMLFAGSIEAEERIEQYGAYRQKAMVGEHAGRPEEIEEDMIPGPMRGHVAIARVGRNFERLQKNEAPSVLSHISGGALTDEDAERELRTWEALAESGETPASILAGG